MRHGSVQKDFNNAGKEGFRVMPNALFFRLRLFNNMETAAIMERTPATANTVYEYVVLATARRSTMDKEIAEAAAEGYEVIAEYRQGSSYITYMERATEETDVHPGAPEG